MTNTHSKIHMINESTHYELYNMHYLQRSQWDFVVKMKPCFIHSSTVGHFRRSTELIREEGRYNLKHGLGSSDVHPTKWTKGLFVFSILEDQLVVGTN